MVLNSDLGIQRNKTCPKVWDVKSTCGSNRVIQFKQHSIQTTSNSNKIQFKQRRMDSPTKEATSLREKSGSESPVGRPVGSRPTGRSVRDSPSRPPRTHSRSSQLSLSSLSESDHSRNVRHPLSSIQRSRPSRSSSISPSRSRHKSIRERFLEEEKLSTEELDRPLNRSAEELNRPLNRRSSIETAIHVPVAEEKDRETDLIQNVESEDRSKLSTPSKLMILFLALYIILGGFVFKFLTFLSCPSKLDLYKRMFLFNQTQDREDEKLLISLWNLTLSLNVLHENQWKSGASGEIGRHRIKLVENTIEFETVKPDASTLPLSASVLYSYSLVSMVGYPDECLNTVVIHTTSWQLVNILFILVGVPLFLLTMSHSIPILSNKLNSLSTIQLLKHSTTKHVLIGASIVIYYPLFGIVIFSLTGSRKPFLDLFNSFTFIGPVNCTHYPKTGDQVSIFTDCLILIKVVYLFLG